jgi:hypothetical protein
LAGVAVVLAGCLLLTAGCGGDENADISTGGPVLGEIPWRDGETAVYRVLDGDEEIGSAGLSIGCNGASGALAGTCVFAQAFEFPDRDITDEVLAVADVATLKPRRVTRTVDGPDGKRTWEATYDGSAVTVEQADENDERTDELDVPQDHYDTWTDLFLWRTLDFSEGYEGKYTGVVTADFSKPDVITIALKVTGLEEVSVPAGTFSAWRLEIRSGGRTQKAWIADNAERTLLRYDNTEIVFELE